MVCTIPKMKISVAPVAITTRSSMIFDMVLGGLVRIII